MNLAVEINIKTSTRVERLGKVGRGNQMYMNFADCFPTQENTIVFKLQMMLLEFNPEFPDFMEMESSRVDPTLGSTRTRGHDDSS